MRPWLRGNKQWHDLASGQSVWDLRYDADGTECEVLVDIREHVRPPVFYIEEDIAVLAAWVPVNW